MSPLIQLTDITRTYYMGTQSLHILKGISLDIQQGEFVSIIGQSGSGKSTLMNMIGLLDPPSSGEYLLNGKKTTSLSNYQRTKIRGEQIGFVFQSYNLIPRLNVFHQVALPLTYQRKSATEIKQKVKQALTEVGLADKMYHNPNQLSGGQQQRVSIARALVTEPSIILADEPTGALDSKTGKEILTLFKQLNKEGKTVIIITHDNDIAKQADRQIVICDGKLTN